MRVEGQPAGCRRQHGTRDAGAARQRVATAGDSVAASTGGASAAGSSGLRRADLDSYSLRAALMVDETTFQVDADGSVGALEKLLDLAEQRFVHANNGVV